ncbi:MAG: thioredoxin family protein [Halofilum sp. (in: g-proteobacteria)]
MRRKLAAAQREGRPVMLDIYADWCVSCKELEAFTFPDPRVQAALEGAVLLRADVTPNDAGDRALLQRFDLYGPPAVLFFGTDGVERRGYRVVGYKGAAEFAEHARQAFGRTEAPS